MISSGTSASGSPRNDETIEIISSDDDGADTDSNDTPGSINTKQAKNLVSGNRKLILDSDSDEENAKM